MAFKEETHYLSSVFGAEFVAMKHVVVVETLCYLRYKLSMMGIPVSRPSFIYGDYMSAIYNTQ